MTYTAIYVDYRHREYVCSHVFHTDNSIEKAWKEAQSLEFDPKSALNYEMQDLELLLLIPGQVEPYDPY